MRQNAQRMILLGWSFGFLLSGCGREPPPEIQQFVPPIQEIVKQTATQEAIDTTPEQEPEPKPKPEPKPEPKKAVPKPKAPPLAPKPQPKEEEPQAPSIIGSWQVSDMSRNGQSMPMPEGVEMTFTFGEDGTVSMTTSMAQMPEPRTMEGTYTLTDDQITISMKGESKTGTYTLQGNDTLILEIDQVQMTLSRT